MTILQRPFEERERIAVVPDSDMGKTAAGIGLAGVGGYLVGSLTGPIGMTIGMSGLTLWWMRGRRQRKKWADLRKNLRILEVERHEAKLLLHFPDNHPKERYLYIGNPASQREYYPAAAYQRLTLQHKALEAAKLLMALGATYLRVEGTATQTQELQEKIEGELGETANEIEVDTSATNGRTAFVVYLASLPAAEDLASPEQLARQQRLSWYSREESFQSAARARMERHVDSLTLEVRHDDDRGINSSFEAELKELGFELGGNIKDEEKQSIGFRMEARFA